MMTSSVSSLNAYQGWLDNSASNVANATNRNNSAVQSTINEGPGSNPTLSSTPTNQPVEMVREMTDQIVIPEAAEANADAIRTQDEMMGTLLDLLA